MPSVAFPPSDRADVKPVRRRRALIPAIVGLLSALALGASGCFNAGVATSADTLPVNLPSLTDGSGTAPSTPVASPPSSAVPPETPRPGSPADNNVVTPAPITPVDGNAVNGAPPPNPTAVTGAARFTRVGRFASLDNGNQLTFRVAGARLGATFTGTSVTASLTDTGGDGLDVYIDGGAAQVVQLDPMAVQTPIVLASGLSSGTHTIWLVKRTEQFQKGSDVACGAITLWDMTLDQGGVFLTPPLGQKRRIEAIGDSSSAGYGVDTLCGDTPDNACSLPKNGYSPRRQDVAKSVPGVVGQLLNADVSNLSFSGQGVIFSYYDQDSCNLATNQTAHCLPTLWQLAVPPTTSPAWDFSQPIDVVILSAGGDDLDAQGRFPSGSDAFVRGFAAWVGQIRARYPTAFIVAVMSQSASGNDIVTLGSALQQGIAAAQAAQPGGTDPNMMYFNYFDGTPYQTYSDIASQLKFYYGSWWHSSAAGSAWLGNRLAAVIAKHMNW